MGHGTELSLIIASQMSSLLTHKLWTCCLCGAYVVAGNWNWRTRNAADGVGHRGRRMAGAVRQDALGLLAKHHSSISAQLCPLGGWWFVFQKWFCTCNIPYIVRCSEFVIKSPGPVRQVFFLLFKGKQQLWKIRCLFQGHKAKYLQSSNQT